MSIISLSSSEMQRKRLSQLSKCVVAASKAIDDKFINLYGEPEFTSSRKYSRHSGYRCALITFTYRPGVEWSPRHISELIKHYREWFRRHSDCGFHYVWSLELTEIGRPHYHLVCWMPKGVKPPLPDKQGWWPHGMTQAIYARSPVGYIVKYASKVESKSGEHLPKGARLWGYGGLTMAERAPVAFAQCPRWLKGLIHHESYPRKRKVVVERPGKYGATLKDTFTAWVLTAGLAAGWFFSGPYSYDGFNGDGVNIRHLGYVEMFIPGEESRIIPHQLKG